MSRPALPEHKVSRNRKVTFDPKSVRVARISDVGTGTITCSCGWVKVHPREKVRGDAAQRHLDKHHGGQGMWF